MLLTVLLRGARSLAGQRASCANPLRKKSQYFLTPWGMSLEILHRPAPLPYERETSACVYGPAPAWR